MKTITSNYTIKNDDKKLILDSSLESFILTLPESIGLGFEVEMICVGGTESVNSITIESTKETIMINGDSYFTINTDRAVVNLALQRTAGKVVHLSCTQGASGGGGGDTGWTYDPLSSTTKLTNESGIRVGTIGNNGTDQNYLELIDTSLGDVICDISNQELEQNNGLIKNYKAYGGNNIILDSFAGFSDDTTQLIVSDSCILFYDFAITGKWQILYNNEWKTKVIDISSAQLLDLTTPIELLPAAGVGKYYDIETTKMKVLFGTTPYDPDSMNKIEVKQGLQTFNFGPNIIAQSSNTFGIGVRSGYTATNQNVTISADAIALDGDGTAQVILQYKVNTF